MKRILVLYYTQTGQLSKILNSILQLLDEKEDFVVEMKEISPELAYPFPWKEHFFKAFPESVLGIPCKISPLEIDKRNNYDLIILGYQPWFLSPSVPFWSFLLSDQAKELLKGKNVITIQGTRNMWVGAHEQVKKQLSKIGARLVGNIVLQDMAPNLISVITIIKWLIHGNKGPYKVLPKAGIANQDIDNAKRFAPIIYRHLTENNLNKLQHSLLEAGAVKIKYHLLRMELTARRIFIKFAHLAVKQEKKGIDKRNRILKVFKWYLAVALFGLSPILSILFRVIGILFYPFIRKRIIYYKSVNYNY